MVRLVASAAAAIPQNSRDASRRTATRCLIDIDIFCFGGDRVLFIRSDRVHRGMHCQDVVVWLVDFVYFCYLGLSVSLIDEIFLCPRLPRIWRIFRIFAGAVSVVMMFSVLYVMVLCLLFFDICHIFRYVCLL